jgi:nucleolar complex protein 2
MALLVHPLVQLIVGVIRLTSNLKWFPFHVKAFELLTYLNEKTGQFVPASQFMMYAFENDRWFNAKPKPLTDKSVPETVIALKVAKKHFETTEVKDRMIRESIEALTLFLAANSKALAFPELIVPLSVVLRKFKKNCSNNSYRKMIGTFLDLLKRSEDWIAAERAKIGDKSLKDPAKIHQQFSIQLKDKDSPLNVEAKKVIARRTEAVERKIAAVTANKK